MTITYEINSRVLPGQYTAVERGEIARQELPGWLGAAFRAVIDHLQRIGVPPIGPPFARFSFLVDTVAVEAGFPVPGEIAGDARVEASTLPGGPAAVTSHTGRYEDLDKAYLAISDWLAKRRYTAAGPHWEVYYTDPRTEPDSSRWRTDVVVPCRIP
jgi:effector-binding domain-containing protein